RRLVAERLAAPGREHDETVSPVEHRPDRILLEGKKRAEAPHLPQGLVHRFARASRDTVATRKHHLPRLGHASILLDPHQSENAETRGLGSKAGEMTQGNSSGSTEPW